MDEDQVIDKIQVLLLGMEERLLARMEEKTSPRFDRLEIRLDGVENRLDRLETRLDRVETKLDSVSRELALNNELLAPFIRWSHHVEDEIIKLSAQLQDVQERLKRLENPKTH